jgi:hypothetical protein
MDHTPPTYAQKIGTPQFPRYVMRDGAGNFWTGTGWSEYPSQAALFCTEADAVADERRFVDGEQLRDTFTLKVVFITDRNAWSREELVTHLTRFCAIVMERSQERRGVVIETHWDDLRKTE